MSRGRFAALLAAALVVISAALYFSTQRNTVTDTPNGALLPGFAAELGTVTAVSIAKGSTTPTVTVHKQGDQWTVLQRTEYTADAMKLRKLLLSVSDARIIEKKTADPANFAIIGVADPTASSDSSVRIDIAAQGGTRSLIVGKPVGQGNFVRRGGENQSYSVEPGIYVETEPRFWIDSKMFDIAATDIRRIEIKFADGPGYVLHRDPPASTNPATAKPATAKPATAGDASVTAATSAAAAPPNNFVLDGVPAGRKPAEPPSLSPSTGAFTGFTADDVAMASELDFSKPSIATLTLNDGSNITISGVVINDKCWITVAGIKDPAFAAKSAGRAYAVARYRYDDIFRPLEQLLVPMPPPKSPSSSSSKPPKP